MLSDVSPKAILITILVIIATVYLFDQLFHNVEMVDPTVALSEPEGVIVDTESKIKFKCVNGYMYYNTNGTWIKANSFMGNPCHQELHQKRN